MLRNLSILALISFLQAAQPAPARAQESGCVDCHTVETPGAVADWKLSRHGQLGLDCSVCHGTHAVRVRGQRLLLHVKSL